MLLSPVEWSMLSKSTTPGPLPSTLLTTPKLERSGIPTYRSPISTATTSWWPTTPERKCCTLGITGVKSPIPSLLRNIRFITWSADDGKQISWSGNALLFVDNAVHVLNKIRLDCNLYFFGCWFSFWEKEYVDINIQPFALWKTRLQNSSERTWLRFNREFINHQLLQCFNLRSEPILGAVENLCWYICSRSESAEESPGAGIYWKSSLSSFLLLKKYELWK